tara:strand:- start:9 stop:326 length:318 start_codon:yes stop_codon:yes gene_type:complete
MSISGRRRIIISGSDATNLTDWFNVSGSLYSASFHSTSSCGSDDLVYYDYDMGDIDLLVSMDRHIDENTTWNQDHSYSVEPIWPPPPPKPEGWYEGCIVYSGSVY